MKPKTKVVKAWMILQRPGGKRGWSMCPLDNPDVGRTKKIAEHVMRLDYPKDLISKGMMKVVPVEIHIKKIKK